MVCRDDLYAEPLSPNSASSRVRSRAIDFRIVILSVVASLLVATGPRACLLFIDTTLRSVIPCLLRGAKNVPPEFSLLFICCCWDTSPLEQAGRALRAAKKLVITDPQIKEAKLRKQLFEDPHAFAGIYDGYTESEVLKCEVKELYCGVEVRELEERVSSNRRPSVTFAPEVRVVYAFGLGDHQAAYIDSERPCGNPNGVKHRGFRKMAADDDGTDLNDVAGVHRALQIFQQRKALLREPVEAGWNMEVCPRSPSEKEDDQPRHQTLQVACRELPFDAMQCVPSGYTDRYSYSFKKQGHRESIFAGITAASSVHGVTITS